MVLPFNSSVDEDARTVPWDTHYLSTVRAGAIYCCFMLTGCKTTQPYNMTRCCQCGKRSWFL